MQIQVILSLIAILGAATIALFCDFLRHKNQRLREAMVELKVLQVEKQRRTGNAAPNPPAGSTARRASVQPEKVESGTSPDSVPVSAGPQMYTEYPFVKKERRPLANPDVEEPFEQKPLVRATPVAVSDKSEIEFTSYRSRRRLPAPESKVDLADDDIHSKKALSDWLIQRATTRAAQKATVEPQAPAPASTMPADVFIEPVPMASPAPEPHPPVEGAAARPKIAPVIVDEFLWRLLVGEEEPQHLLPAPVSLSTEEPLQPEVAFEVIEGAASAQGDLIIPAGFHEASALLDLSAAAALFSGLVISIGINSNDSRSARSQEVMRSVTSFIQSLLQESYFACQSSDEDYLLICPNETGIAAQRHLNSLSEQLWDFQLRALNSHSMVLSMGSVDVEKEPLADAIASANERMAQTRRSRKPIVMPARQRRRAV